MSRNEFIYNLGVIGACVASITIMVVGFVTMTMMSLPWLAPITVLVSVAVFLVGREIITWFDNRYKAGLPPQGGC